MPTLLNLAGVPALATSHGKPAKPIQGKSLASVLRDAEAPATRNEQYYECWANRAYYREGWVAVSLQKRGEAIDFDNWTLHAHAEDFSESMDLRRQHPQKLEELVAAFDEAAWANMVYPLDNRTPAEKFLESPPHQRPPANSRRRFLPNGQTVHRGVIAPLIGNRNFKIVTRFRHGAGDEGVLFAIGDVTGGLVLYIEDGVLRLTYNGFGRFHTLSGPPGAGGRAQCGARIRGARPAPRPRPAGARLTRPQRVGRAQPDPDGWVSRGARHRSRSPRPGR